MNKVDMRKVIGTVIGGIIFLCCIAFFTYAFYIWRSGNTVVNLGIKDSADINFAMGSDVNVTNIGPVLDYNDGVKTTFTVTNSSESNVGVYVSLDISSITSTLQVESFKYKLLKDTSGGTNYTTEVASGNFSTFSEGMNSIVSNDIVSGSTVCSYLFVVYIDGTMVNNIDMRGDALVSNLVVSDEVIEALVASDYIQNLYNDGSTLSTVNIGNDTSYPTVSLNVAQGIMLDNNGDYRYYGSNPNNYVWYNPTSVLHTTKNHH